MKTLSQKADRQEVEERLEKLAATAERRWGKMTAHQMVCHLTDSFGVPMGEKTASAASGPIQRTIIKWAALQLPLKWPHGSKTRPEVDQMAGGTRPVDFNEDVTRLKNAMRRIAAPDRDFEWHPHPLFGPMTEAEWLRWGYLHTDHHLRQFGL